MLVQCGTEGKPQYVTVNWPLENRGPLPCFSGTSFMRVDMCVQYIGQGDARSPKYTSERFRNLYSQKAEKA